MMILMKIAIANVVNQQDYKKTLMQILKFMIDSQFLFLINCFFQKRKTLGYDMAQKRVERAKKMQMFVEATQNQKYSDFEIYLAHIEKNFNQNNFLIMSNLNRQKAAYKNRIKNTKQINLMTQSSIRNSFLASTKNISMGQPRTQSYLIRPNKFDGKVKDNSPSKYFHNSLEFIQEENFFKSQKI
eukprot:TRINITY_DN4530_c0_g1_i3.p1 TRINITY_DN4530_c0_g1~~TRINITY_DN4530_c0_g1_i3.p1  ORF type:complete len:185 (-),score=13.51 TRINITY_DN4530_c0_g1_i3:19-573(-)